MRTRWVLAVGIGMLSIVLLGCSQKGYLTVENKTAGTVTVTVDRDTENLNAGRESTWVYEFPGFILNLIQQEVKDVRVDYSGVFVFADSTRVYIEAGNKEFVDITATGGAVIISNESNRNIIDVRIVPSDSTSWGSNRITSAIPPGQARYWTVAAGSWDVMVLDSDGYYPAGLPRNSVAVNQARTFRWGNTSWSFTAEPHPQALGALDSVKPAAGESFDAKIQAVNP